MGQTSCCRIGLALLCLSLIGVATPVFSADVQPPCSTTEPMPASDGPDPTVRDPVMTFSTQPKGGLLANVQTCLVFGESQNDYPKGAYFNWGMALLGDDHRLLGINGGQLTLSAIPSGHVPFPVSTGDVGVYLNSDQHPTELIAQVVIEKVGLQNDQNSPTPYDAHRTVSVLMYPKVPSPSGSSPTTKIQNNRRSLGGNPCLARVARGKRKDPELRDIIISVTSKGSYHIVACLASNRFASFDHVSLDVELWKGDCADGENHCTDAAPKIGTGADQVGHLFGRRGTMPQTVVMFDVEVSPVTTALPVKRADVTLSYTGCPRDPSKKCKKVSLRPKRRNVKFVDVMQ